MDPVERRYSKEEIARRGDAIYRKDILPKLTAKDRGKFLAIDIETGEYEMARDEMRACNKVRTRIPQAQILMVRVGYAAVHSFGGGQKTAGIAMITCDFCDDRRIQKKGVSMTTIPTKQAAAEKETITARFQRLAATWHKATDHLSSMSAASSHPAHQGIISLGKEAVPLLLRDLEDNHTHWFIALREITGAQPIPPSASGNIPQMVQAWLQ